MKIFKILTTMVLMITLSFLIAYGSNSKKTYKNDTNFEKYIAKDGIAVMYLHYPFDENYDVYGAGFIPKSIKELENNSDIIIKAKLANPSKRSIYYGCVLSQIEVIDVFKGHASKNQIINLFEPIECTGIEGVLISSEGYSPMVYEEEYILFLNTLKDALFSENEYVYIPSTITYSKYKLSGDNIQLFSEEELDEGDLSVKYSEVKHEDVYLHDEEMYSRYISLKSFILEKYNI